MADAGRAPGAGGHEVEVRQCHLTTTDPHDVARGSTPRHRPSAGTARRTAVGRATASEVTTGSTPPGTERYSANRWAASTVAATCGPCTTSATRVETAAGSAGRDGGRSVGMGRRYRGVYSDRMVIVANDQGRDAQTLPSNGETAARPTVDLDALPHDPAERAAALERIVEQQAALLEREDEVHRVLVRIVLAGGALAELGDAVVGFFQGTAVVTTTDGRVLAMAGDEAEVARTRALDCFDRTGRLVVESEPVGPRDPGSPGSTRAFVRIVAGSSDHGLLGAFSPRARADRRRRAPARAGRHRRGAGHHQGAGGLRRSRASTAPSSCATPSRGGPASRPRRSSHARIPGLGHRAADGRRRGRDRRERRGDRPARRTRFVLFRNGSCAPGCRPCGPATPACRSSGSARRSWPWCRWAPTPTRMP